MNNDEVKIQDVEFLVVLDYSDGTATVYPVTKGVNTEDLEALVELQGHRVKDTEYMLANTIFTKPLNLEDLNAN